MSSPAKDRITCHVLDTTAGKPAKGIRVRLETSSTVSSSSSSSSPNPSSSSPHPPASFESLTDEDGRVKTWLPYSTATSSGEVPVYTLDDVLGAIKGPSRWTLRFDTEGYFGEANTFFPEATVVFRVDEGQQYHVPLLLSPYSYTTYRGS
ncbi:transthyretin domain protein [Drechmeria coniospora]|uniref:5-hydroxyisourate hydrolase n=1 Tax=Drechmeria coniospora TaxID=98403 RepID=A0A151GV84_DRECN|nr:transthyretin domain protein [Drechmeria coniospora]KYK60980.1 transthyretin domain protein [Drechmeria coniospora]ODA83664.1 hypothetical protein RJ55_02179 [Drechmeria coniospora]